MNIRRLIWFFLLVFTSRVVAELPAGWNTNFTSALVAASISNRPILAFFTASWCPLCRMMVHSTLTNAEVRVALGALLPVAIDIDDHPDLAREGKRQALF